MIKKKYTFIILLSLVMTLLFACGEAKNIWDMENYKNLDDIISIGEVVDDGQETVITYKIRYKSDECEVVSYLSIPEKCLEKQEASPCIIFCRGGNRDYSANTSESIANQALAFDKIVFASQYRGVDGGSGREEFGGADVNDVMKQIDLCEEFQFVDMDELYMVGMSRGGMMTYEVIRQDERIKKAVVVSGLADSFMWYEERSDVRLIYATLVGGTPEKIPEEFEKRSATYWAGELKCPVLIIHSKLDEKVAYAQAEKMVQCLEDAGMEYKFVSYEDAVHGYHLEDIEIITEWLK